MLQIQNKKKSIKNTHLNMFKNKTILEYPQFKLIFP